MHFKMNFKITLLFLLLLAMACKDKATDTTAISGDLVIEPLPETSTEVILAANQTEVYLTLLQGKKVGLVTNATSLVKRADGTFVHLVDTLLALNVNLTKVFAPEHGFRGTADAGEKVADERDAQTGLPIVSLYGLNRKPSPKQLENVEVLLFDLQDVGVRFYTYISTLTYVMESAAEIKLPLIVLDRPNPNIHIVDGPVLDMKNRSFVGMHPVPVLHGMTMGEYAQMVNGEKWLKNEVTTDLTVIPLKNYTRQTSYSVPVRPSPNLPNDKAINLYASLCFFEGTNVSVGRGTDKPFQQYGAPFLPKETLGYSFTPEPNEGASKPMYEAEVCFGEDLSSYQNLNELTLRWLIKAYALTPDKSTFFNKYFVKLAGTETLQKQIEEGVSEAAIQASWQEGLENFKALRKPYLIYE